VWKILGVHYDQQLSRSIMSEMFLVMYTCIFTTKAGYGATCLKCNMASSSCSCHLMDWLWKCTFLTGISSEKMLRLKNTCARVISLTHRIAHIRPILKALHCLPVKERIEFNVLVHTYSALQGSSPLYITDMLKLNTPARPLHSGD